MFAKKDTPNNQGTRIVIDLTPEQKERWEKAAQKRGLSLEAFVKGCVNAEVHKEGR